MAKNNPQTVADLAKKLTSQERGLIFGGYKTACLKQAQTGLLFASFVTVHIDHLIYQTQYS